MLERLRQRWPLKLLSLGIAFFIWFSITGQDRTVRDVTVPLEVVLGRDMIATEIPPRAVVLRLEGPRITLRRLEAIDLAVRVDLARSPVGRRDIALSLDQLRGVPPGVSVTMFQPARITVDIARRAEKSVPVKPAWGGRPAAGFKLYGWEIDPPEIRVRGPQELVSALDVLETEAIPIEGRSESLQTDIELFASDPQLEFEESGALGIRVHIGALPQSRVVESIPVTLPSSPGGSLRARPDKVSVTLSGPPDILAGVEAAQIVVTASLPDPSNDRSTRVSLTGDLRVPEEVRPFLRIESIRPAQTTLARIEEE